MRTLTTLFNAEKNKKTGASPVWILRIGFPLYGYLYLSDRAVNYGLLDIKPWIASWGGIDEDISNSLTSPMVSDFSCNIIIDPNEAPNIHDIIWSENVETINCELYLWFEGLDAGTDPLIHVWTGNIIDFERVSELVYRVDLVDHGVKFDKYPGRVLSLIDYPNAAINDVGSQMPIIYGAVEKVPALRLDYGPRTSLAEEITTTQTDFDLTSATGITNSSLIMIGAERVAITGLTGNNITACRRGDNSAGIGTFRSIHLAAGSYFSMCCAPNGDVYTAVFTGGIYLQTQGVGEFIALGGTTRDWTGMCAAPNGDIYASVFNGDIYKRALGTGSFDPLSQTTRNWTGMCAAPNGNIYCAVFPGDIYMRTNGAGAFAPLSQTSRSWRGMAGAPNGNIYASVESGDIYMRTNGAGAFAPLSQTSRLWSYMTAAPNGDIYCSVAQGDVYRQAAGAGDFVGLGQGIRDWRGLAVSASGDISAAVTGVGIFYMPGTTTAHGLGALVAKVTTTIHLFADHPVKSIDNVYAKVPYAPPADITSQCTKYTGQGGANDLAGYEGMAVVVAPFINSNLNDQLLISGKGYQDGGAALIERPDLVIEHFLLTYAGWPNADFEHAGAATALTAKGYPFAVVINARKKNNAWLAYMALQCRCWFRFAGGKAYLLYRPDALVSDKTIPAAMIGMNGDGTTTLRITRSPLDEIINKISLHYSRDWTKSAGAEAYQAITRAEDAASILAYGEKERPDAFRFDFVRDAAGADALAAFYLARYKDRKKVVTGTLFLDNVELEFADGITLLPLGDLLCEVRKVGIAPGMAETNDKIFLTAREY